MAADPMFMIVGGGLAGAKAAETLRTEGFHGRIVLACDEAEPPYERPPLSKGYLTGAAARDSAYVHETQWYLDQAVELRTSTRVVRIDPQAHLATTDAGEAISFTALLLTTGSTPRALEVPGGDLDGVLTLRKLPDADRLRAELSAGGRRVVVVGGGWIGLETAAAARGYGNDVVVVEPQSTVLRAALGDDLGNIFAQLHRDHGVDLRLNTGVLDLQGSDGRVSAVRTQSGDVIPADVVIVGVGIRPNTALAEGAGLAVDNGVLVDQSLRSSHPDVYAAGDVANAYHPSLGHHLRVEHWANALHGGPAAARAMLGQTVSYDRVPYFFTDQYEVGMEYSGYVAPDGHDRIVYRGDPSTREFVAFWLRGRRVMAGMNVNVWGVTEAIQSLIRSGSEVDPEALTDPRRPLTGFAVGES